MIRLDTGLIVAELPAGRKEAALALPAGAYLVRRRSGGAVFAREIDLEAGGAVEIAEEDLLLVGAQPIAAKGVPPLHGATSLRAGEWELRLAVGRVYDDTTLLFGGAANSRGGTGTSLAFAVGLTDRLMLSISNPGLAWRFGDRGDHELLVWAGLFPNLAQRTMQRFGRVLPGASLTSRLYLRPSQSLLFGLGVATALSWAHGESALFETVRAEAQAGYVLTIGEVVTLAFGVQAGQQFEDDALIRSTRRGLLLQLGSVLDLGVRPLPLVQVHVLDVLSLDGYVETGWNLTTGELNERYLGGFTWTF